VRATVLFVVLVACCGCGKEGGGTSGAPADWTHKDLTDHFAKKKLGYKFIVHTSGSGILPPSGYYVPESSTARNWQDVESDIKAGKTDAVHCELRKTPQEAKDTAGTWGERGLASGRFAFKGDPRALAKVRDALP